MGEKIRDIKEINVGSCRFMVELNEGYLDEGRVIHVQNHKFRYLFREKQFYKLCANFMRSKSELDYIRLHRTANLKPVDNHFYDPVDTETINSLNEFLKIIHDSGISYRVIDCKKKMATLIVSPEMRRKFSLVINRGGKMLTELNHPYGKMFGYVFLYQMDEFRLVKYKDIYIEVFFQLPCMSLERNTWIPLDRMIQKRVWANDTRGLFSHMIDDESLFVYLLCVCVFQYKVFPKAQVMRLIEVYKKTDKRCLKELLGCVFFSYTDNLMFMIKNKKYDKIIKDYYSYKDY